jgi:hypothetical protein
MSLIIFEKIEMENKNESAVVYGPPVIRETPFQFYTRKMKREGGYCIH